MRNCMYTEYIYLNTYRYARIYTHANIHINLCIYIYTHIVPRCIVVHYCNMARMYFQNNVQF